VSLLRISGRGDIRQAQPLLLRTGIALIAMMIQVITIELSGSTSHMSGIHVTRQVYAGLPPQFKFIWLL